MKKQSYFREFMHYSWLSVLGMLGVSCYILADTFFISSGVGMNGLAALNLAIPAYNFLHGTALMLAIGGATKFSIYKSRGDQKRMDQVYTQTICLAVAFSLLFMAAGWFGSGPLARLLGANDEVLEMTDTYLKWLLLFTPAFTLNEVLLCFVRNDGSPRLAMIGMVVGSLANILMDYIFIFPLDMGILGAVLATGTSPLLGIVIMLPHWFRKKNTFHFVRPRVQGRMVGELLAIGFPSLISQVSAGIVMIMFNVLILGLADNVGVAAYGVVANISIVVVSVYAGLGQGVQPLISKSYGAGDSGKIGQLYRYAMGTMAVFSVLFYVIVFLLADPVAAAFNSEHSVQLQEIAVEGLQLYFTASLFMGYNTVLSTFFSSVEQNLPAHVLSLLRGLVLIIPLAYLLAEFWGMTGIWLTYPLTEGIVAVIGFLWYHYGKGGKAIGQQ